MRGRGLLGFRVEGLLGGCVRVWGCGFVRGRGLLGFSIEGMLGFRV